MDVKIMITVILINALKMLGKLENSTDWFKHVEKIIRYEYTPNSIKVLYKEIGRIIQFALEFKFEDSAVALLKRMDELVKDLREDQYFSLADNIDSYFKELRPQVGKEKEKEQI
jgi:Asp-tRNA(Asn)/Glu-tRNA(Gln) amidotransferase C subunit